VTNYIFDDVFHHVIKTTQIATIQFDLIGQYWWYWQHS